MMCEVQNQVYGASGWLIRDRAQQQQPADQSPLLWLVAAIVALLLLSSKGDGK